MKKFLIMTLIVSMAILTVGCGESAKNEPDKPVNQVQISGHDESTPEIPEITEEGDTAHVLKNYDISEYNHHYISPYNSFKLIGLKEYESLESKFGTDTPAEGNKFLVVFLEVGNTWNDKFYFSPDYMTVSVDGNPVERTYLKNEPETYKSIFQNIYPEETIQGYFVCEVPENWQSMTYTYSGWQYVLEQGMAIISDTVTPADLFDPEVIDIY